MVRTYTLPPMFLTLKKFFSLQILYNNINKSSSYALFIVCIKRRRPVIIARTNNKMTIPFNARSYVIFSRDQGLSLYAFTYIRYNNNIMGHFEWYTSILQLPRISNLLSTTYLYYMCTYMFIILNLYTYNTYYIGICAFFSSMIFFSFPSTYYTPPPFNIISTAHTL